MILTVLNRSMESGMQVKIVFTLKITLDNLDQVRRNVTEAKVKFPEKQAELLKLLDEMGEDDNPIIAFYKLKD